MGQVSVFHPFLANQVGSSRFALCEVSTGYPLLCFRGAHFRFTQSVSLVRPQRNWMEHYVQDQKKRFLRTCEHIFRIFYYYSI